MDNNLAILNRMLNDAASRADLGPEYEELLEAINEQTGYGLSGRNGGTAQRATRRRYQAIVSIGFEFTTDDPEAVEADLRRRAYLATPPAGGSVVGDVEVVTYAV